jgi:beta-glucosidase
VAVAKQLEPLLTHTSQSTDGPNGARGESYVSGIKAACFQCATSLGASFDTNILHRIGEEIAKEAITKSANVLLAPTLNVIRSPLGTYARKPAMKLLVNSAVRWKEL